MTSAPLANPFQDLVRHLTILYSENIDIGEGPELKQDPELRCILDRYFGYKPQFRTSHPDFVQFCYHYSHILAQDGAFGSPPTKSIEILPTDPRLYGAEAIDDSESWHEGMFLFARAEYSRDETYYSASWQKRVPVSDQVAFFLAFGELRPCGIYCETSHYEFTPDDELPPLDFYCQSFTEWLGLYVAKSGRLLQ